MRDARWNDVYRALTSMSRHLEEATRLFAEGELVGRDRAAYQRQMILMHTMEVGYTSFESAILRVMQILRETPPGGSDWHAQLLARASEPVEGLRPQILPADLAAAADLVKSFRHWAMHGYDTAFRPAHAALAIEAAHVLLRDARPAFEVFASEIDP